METRALKSTQPLAGPAAALKSRRLGLGFVLVLALIAILPASPWLVQTPNNDSSIFMYMGRQILAGNLPYRDAYDHKPPLIFYLDALALWLGGGQAWGIWALQILSLIVAAWLAFLILERYFGLLPAVIGASAALLNLAFVHERGNLTEEYALPLQFGSVFLLSSALRAARPGWRFFGIGLLLGLASTLKQPMAGIGIAIAVYLLVVYAAAQSWKKLFVAYLQIAAGALLPWLLWFAYFAAAGILPEYWEAAFLMNFGVSSLSNLQRFESISNAFTWLTGSSGFFTGGMLIWLAVLPILIVQDQRVRAVLFSRWTGVLPAGVGLGLLANGMLRSGLQFYALNELSSYRWALILSGLLVLALAVWWLSGRLGQTAARLLVPLDSPGQVEYSLPLIVALVDFPVAFLAGTLTGRAFPHYFMPLLPSLALLFGFAAYSLLAAAGPETPRVLSWIWLVVLLIPVLVPGIVQTKNQIVPSADRQVIAAAQYIQSHTQPGDPVLQWGISPAVYELSGHTAPTRFFFGNTLFFDGYSGSYHTSRLLSDLQANPPILIVDALMSRLPLVTTPDWQDCDRLKDPAYYQSFVDARRTPDSVIPLEPEGMGHVYAWICENYAPQVQVGELGWMVYRLKGK